MPTGWNLRQGQDALNSRSAEEAPSHAELRELQGGLPLDEAIAERKSTRILPAALNRDEGGQN
jgi:hypothetical protein